MAVKCKLKEIRQEHGLQQDELAAAVLTDKRTISRYETGVRSPTLEMALRLSAYFNLAVNELFELDGFPILPVIYIMNTLSHNSTYSRYLSVSANSFVRSAISR